MRELQEETGLIINISANHPFIKINNSKYYIFCLEKDTLPTFQPIDTNEINDVAFININNIMGLTINKEVVLMLKRKLNIAKKYAIVLRL